MTSRMATKLATCLARRHALRCAAAAPENRRLLANGTKPLLEKHTTKVPTMGDAITEGTIVEWVASVGQLVQEDDVVALIETDKVTVDIKADVTGVLTQQFAAVDDWIEVGSDLYEIDTNANVTAAAPETPPPTDKAQGEKAPPLAEPPAIAAVSATSSTDLENEKSKHNRIPSIQFLGKEGWAQLLTTPEPGVCNNNLPADYGRPAFSEDEIEALVLGGANLVPEVTNY